MKKILIVLFAFAAALTGCTSVPHIDRYTQIEDGKYDVAMDRDYMDDPKEFEYAVNSFVKDKGQDSYDIEKYGPNDFYITMPGSQNVKDLQEVKHFHVGRTLGLAIPGTVGAGLLAVIIILLL